MLESEKGENLWKKQKDIVHLFPRFCQSWE